MSEPNTNTTAKTETKPALPTKLDDVSTSHFTADKLQDGFTLLQHFVNLSFPLVDNFRRSADGKVEWDPSHDLYIFTIGKTVTTGTGADKVSKRVPHIVVPVAVPSIGTIASTEAGQKYLADSLLSSFERKIRSTFGKIDTVDLKDLREVKLPYSVEDFLTSGRGESTDQIVYKEYAKKMQKVLGEKGLSISVNALRECLMSKGVAEANYPKINQKVWETLLNGATAMAKRDGKSPAIFEHWLASREQASSDVVIGEDFDFNA